MSDATAPPVTIVEFLKARLDEDAEAAKAAADEAWSARHDPARAFADTVAKWAIVADHRSEEVASLESGTWAQVYVVCSRCRVGERQVVAPCPTLKHLAWVYSDHPDYQEEWKIPGSPDLPRG